MREISESELDIQYINGYINLPETTPEDIALRESLLKLAIEMLKDAPWEESPEYPNPTKNA